MAVASQRKMQWSALIPGKKFLRLFALNQDKDNNNLWGNPNLLLQKFPAPSFKATTKVELHTDSNTVQNKKAGLIIMGLDYAYLSVNKMNKDILLKWVNVMKLLKVVLSKALKKKILLVQQSIYE